VPGQQRRRRHREDLRPAPPRDEPVSTANQDRSARSYRTRPMFRRSTAFSCRSTSSSASLAWSPRSTRTARPNSQRISKQTILSNTPSANHHSTSLAGKTGSSTTRSSFRAAQDGDHPTIAKQVAAAAVAGLVVEKRVLVVPDGLGVVLVGEDLARAVEDLPGRGLEPERAVLAAEHPDYVPGAQADLVDGPGVTGTDQQVPVGVEVDGVDVEPVQGVAADAGRGCSLY
jgi:hypothetical protein